MLSKRSYQRYASLTLSMNEWLATSCAFSCVLLTARMIVTGSDAYVFLAWNLFLGFLPYAISNRLIKKLNAGMGRYSIAIMLILWFLFIPNSFYILTDLFHLEDIDSAPKWFDLLMILAFAWSGLLFGILSVAKMQALARQTLAKQFPGPLLFIVMWLNAFGVYIGRFLRYNSWDVITQPFSLCRDMLQMAIHPISNKMEWGMVFLYALFMTLLYTTVSKMAIHLVQNNYTSPIELTQDSTTLINSPNSKTI